MERCRGAPSDTRRVGPITIAGEASAIKRARNGRSIITTDTVDRFLHYIPEYKVLVCKEHCYALRNLDLHLRDSHTIAVGDRRAIAGRYAALSLAKPAEVPLPPPLSPPFEALGQPMDGILCDEEECGFISINRTRMRMHCNKEHGWRSKQNQREHWTSTEVQTFFSSSGL